MLDKDFEKHIKDNLESDKMDWDKEAMWTDIKEDLPLPKHENKRRPWAIFITLGLLSLLIITAAFYHFVYSGYTSNIAQTNTASPSLTKAVEKHIVTSSVSSSSTLIKKSDVEKVIKTMQSPLLVNVNKVNEDKALSSISETISQTNFPQNKDITTDRKTTSNKTNNTIASTLKKESFSNNKLTTTKTIDASSLPVMQMSGNQLIMKNSQYSLEPKWITFINALPILESISGRIPVSPRQKIDINFSIGIINPAAINNGEIIKTIDASSLPVMSMIGDQLVAGDKTKEDATWIDTPATENKIDHTPSNATIVNEEGNPIEPIKTINQFNSQIKLVAGIGTTTINNTEVNIIEPNCSRKNLTTLETISGGLGVRTYLNNRIYIDASVEYARTTERLEGNYQESLTTTMQSDSASYVTLNSGGQIYQSGTLETIQLTTYNTTSHNEYHEVNIPIQVGYRLPLRKLELTLATGPILGISNSYSGEVICNNELEQVTGISGNRFIRAINSEVALSYPITPRISTSLGFQYRYGLEKTDLIHSGQHNNSNNRIDKIGLQTAFSYNF